MPGVSQGFRGHRAPGDPASRSAHRPDKSKGIRTMTTVTLEPTAQVGGDHRCYICREPIEVNDRTFGPSHVECIDRLLDSSRRSSR